MILSPSLRKLSLTLHLTLSIGWIGAVVAFLALSIAAVAGHDTQVVRSACIGMEPLVLYVIVPLAFASFLSGLLSALGTQWGLFRHYWVLIKLVLSTVAILVLLKQLAPIQDLATLASGSTSVLAELQSASRRPLIHAAGGLVVLLAVQVLGVYKPRGVTPYGRRRRAQVPALED